MSDSVRPHRRQPTRLPRPWDSPGKNTGVGCYFLLQCMKVKSESEVPQSCPTLVTPWTAAQQGPPSMGFSRQKYWSGVPLPSPVLLLLSHFSVSDSLQPHESQHARPPCPSPTPEVHSNSHSYLEPVYCFMSSSNYCFLTFLRNLIS